MSNKIKLNKDEVNVLSNFYYQVNNGGLAQYMGNGYASDEATELLEVLAKCELNDTRKKIDGDYSYQDGECEFCTWGCQEDCEEEDEDGEIGECNCECDCWRLEETTSFEDLDEGVIYEEPSSWDDYEFYKSEDSKRIKEILEFNEGFVSKTGSIILDALTKEEA